jgi:NTP pyrophosphatase (non-canonical NTP hydrolase)
MELPEQNITLKKLQVFIKNKDYNPGMEYGYFLKLIEEIGELAEVIRKRNKLGKDDDIKGTIDEELYDVLYYVIALANLYDVDLEKSCLLKEKINADRKNS